jgi:hypothetical protein
LLVGIVLSPPHENRRPSLSVFVEDVEYVDGFAVRVAVLCFL